MGGQAVQDEPLQRKVSKAAAAKTRVTATVDEDSDYVDVWANKPLNDDTLLNDLGLGHVGRRSNSDLKLRKLLKCV